MDPSSTPLVSVARSHWAQTPANPLQLGAAGHPRPKPGEEEEAEDDTEETPPGEHKREPIKDPDPADTQLHA